MRGYLWGFLNGINSNPMCSLKLVWITCYLCINGPTCLLSPSLKVTQYLPYKSMLVLVTQLCPTLCDPVDCSLPGSSVHGIFQARVLEWGAISFSKRSSWPRDWTQVSCIVRRCFTIWATTEVTSPAFFLENLNYLDLWKWSFCLKMIVLLLWVFPHIIHTTVKWPKENTDKGVHTCMKV